jgi:hypothetical protein
MTRPPVARPPPSARRRRSVRCWPASAARPPPCVSPTPWRPTSSPPSTAARWPQADGRRSRSLAAPGRYIVHSVQRIASRTQGVVCEWLIARARLGGLARRGLRHDEPSGRGRVIQIVQTPLSRLVYILMSMIPHPHQNARGGGGWMAQARSAGWCWCRCWTPSRAPSRRRTRWRSPVATGRIFYTGVTQAPLIVCSS